MDKLDRNLQEGIKNLKTHPAIKVALRLGKKKLNKYYSRTDLSETYRIAMGKSNFPTVSIPLTLTPLPLCSDAPAIQVTVLPRPEVAE
jgi:hypothetical protein